MAAGAPPPEYAAVWAKEATDAGTLHAGPVKQGKGLLTPLVCAAMHARLAQHRRHGSHGMGQQVKWAGRWGWASRPAGSAAQAPARTSCTIAEARPPTTPLCRGVPVDAPPAQCGLMRGGGSQLTLFSVNKYGYNPSTNPPLIRH